MTNPDYVLPADQRPAWLQYPRAFGRIVEQRLYDLRPWRLLEGQEAQVRSRALAARYPSRELFPFAYRQDNDDLACWSSAARDQVFVIHDFASPGWEDEEAFEDTWSWFRHAVELTIDWDL